MLFQPILPSTRFYTNDFTLKVQSVFDSWRKKEGGKEEGKGGRDGRKEGEREGRREGQERNEIKSNSQNAKLEM